MSKLNIRQMLEYVGKSKFIRSIFFEIVAIFMVVIIVTVAVMLVTFNTEFNKQTVLDSKNELDILESNISSRMEEITSVSYNIGQDQMFYFTPVEGVDYTGYEMSRSLSRYIVGNRFIDNLAFYRLADPDTIYASTGETTYHRFWNSYLLNDDFTEEAFLEKIKTQNSAQLTALTLDGKNTYFVYVCPLPQFSLQPLAFVIALIPYGEISDALDSLLVGSEGAISIFDASNALICSASTDENLILEPSDKHSEYTNSEFTANGSKYILQSKTSAKNNWTYVSATKVSGLFSGLAGTQILIIVAMALLMAGAIFVVLIGIIRKYMPISNLAQELSDSPEGAGVVDEKALISETIETLRSDSEQKQQFEQAYNEAHQASKAKSAFLSNMSHDIRTPMNAVLGMIGLARKHIDDRDYVDDCLKKADVASHYLLELINNVLDMSRIESGKISISDEIINLPDFFYGLITITNSNVGGKKQRLIADTEGIHSENVRSDSLRLTQVCMNILSNAIKYTPDCGTIRIKLSQSELFGDGTTELRFTCTDNGIGMAPEFTANVFDPFVRETSSGVSKIEGTGLGMAIAKNLVDMMGGTISCESVLGKGTTFTVTLRLATVPGDEPLPEQPEDRSVLILCEDDTIRRHQLNLFEQLGFRCEGVSDVGQATEALKNESGGAFDFLLIDLISNSSTNFTGLENALDAEKTRVILAATEFSVVDRINLGFAEDRIFIRTPLFRSTVLNALNKTSASEIIERDRSKTEDLVGLRVLLAEDNEMNRLIADTILSEAGIEVTQAKDGAEAIRLFTQSETDYFDVILMDVQMPEVDGIKATIAIRSCGRSDALSVPIYAMTANTFDEDVRDVLRAGMNGHIGKPYSPEDLYTAVRQAIANK